MHVRPLDFAHTPIVQMVSLFHYLDHIFAVDRSYFYVHAFVSGCRHILTDIISPDRDLTMSAIYKDCKLYCSGTTKR